MNVAPDIRADPKLEADELWFKDAIIYQLHVKAFADSNHDGIGDFAGLTEKLDYLQDLGVTALWLLPFYPSSLALECLLLGVPIQSEDASLLCVHFQPTSEHPA